MGGPIKQRTAFLTNAEKAYWPDGIEQAWPDRLPLAALLDMAARGEVIHIEGITGFMRADVHWIEPEEYGAEFDRLCAADALEDEVRRAFADTPSAPSLWRRFWQTLWYGRATG